jgi:hypothetical protein
MYRVTATINGDARFPEGSVLRGSANATISVAGPSAAVAADALTVPVALLVLAIVATGVGLYVLRQRVRTRRR